MVEIGRRSIEALSLSTNTEVKNLENPENITNSYITHRNRVNDVSLSKPRLESIGDYYGTIGTEQNKTHLPKLKSVGNLSAVKIKNSSVDDIMKLSHKLDEYSSNLNSQNKQRHVELK